MWTLALFCVMPGSLATIAGPVNAPPSQPSAGFDCGTDVSLDFEARACSTGSPLQNNLGGHGPDSGTPELRYGQVGELNGQPFDLVITNTTEYHPKDGTGKTGCRGAFGQINVQLGWDTGFRMQLRDSGTDALVAVPGFHFSVFDLDGRQGSKYAEKLVVEGYEEYSVSAPTNVILGQYVGGRPTSFRAFSWYGSHSSCLRRKNRFWNSSMATKSSASTTL